MLSSLMLPAVGRMGSKLADTFAAGEVFLACRIFASQDLLPDDLGASPRSRLVDPAVGGPSPGVVECSQRLRGVQQGLREHQDAVLGAWNAGWADGGSRT